MMLLMYIVRLVRIRKNLYQMSLSVI